MTGWRVGYAAGPAEVIQAMAKLQQYYLFVRQVWLRQGRWLVRKLS